MPGPLPCKPLRPATEAAQGAAADGSSSGAGRHGCRRRDCGRGQVVGLSRGATAVALTGVSGRSLLVAWGAGRRAARREMKGGLAEVAASHGERMGILDVEVGTREGHRMLPDDGREAIPTQRSSPPMSPRSAAIAARSWPRTSGRHAGCAMAEPALCGAAVTASLWSAASPGVLTAVPAAVGIVGGGARRDAGPRVWPLVSVHGSSRPSFSSGSLRRGWALSSARSGPAGWP